MDEAFVQNSEDDVNDEDSHGQQQSETFERLLKGLGSAFETGGDGERKGVLSESLHFIDGLAQSDAGSKIKRNGDRGQLTRVIHGQRTQTSGHTGNRAQGNKIAAARSNVQIGEHVGVTLIRSEEHTS